MSNREDVFRCKSIIHIHRHEPQLPTNQTTQQLLVLQPTNAPPTAMVHDVQRSSSLLRRVCADYDLLAVSHCDLVVLLFFDSSDGGVACGHVLLGHGEEVAEGRDVAEHTDVEGFAAHGLEDLGLCIRLRGLGGGNGH